MNIVNMMNIAERMGYINQLRRHSDRDSAATEPVTNSAGLTVRLNDMSYQGAGSWIYAARV